MSEGKKDDGRKAEESRLAKVKGIRFVKSGSGEVEIATVGPRQAEALRRQYDRKKQAEREAAGDDTGGPEPGEETTTNE